MNPSTNPQGGQDAVPPSDLFKKISALSPEGQRKIEELLFGPRRNLRELVGNLMGSDQYSGENRANNLLTLQQLMDTEGSGVFALIKAIAERPEKRKALAEHLALLPREPDEEISEEDGRRLAESLRNTEKTNFLKQLKA